MTISILTFPMQYVKSVVHRCSQNDVIMSRVPFDPPDTTADIALGQRSRHPTLVPNENMIVIPDQHKPPRKKWPHNTHQKRNLLFAACKQHAFIGRPFERLRHSPASCNKVLSCWMALYTAYTNLVPEQTKKKKNQMTPIS